MSGAYGELGPGVSVGPVPEPKRLPNAGPWHGVSNAQMAMLIATLTYSKFSFDLEQIVSRAKVIKGALDGMDHVDR